MVVAGDGDAEFSRAVLSHCLGQVHITGGLASILIATSPLFAVLAAHHYTQDEGLTLGKVFGVLAGLVGVVFLIGPELLGDIGKDFLAQPSVFGAAILYAISAIYGRRFAARRVPPIMVATGQMTMATVLLLPFALIVAQPWNLSNPGLPAWSAMVGLAVVSTSFAYLIYFRILQQASAINILLVNFLVPVSALLLGIFVLGETLTTEQMIGMGFIVVGLVLGRLHGTGYADMAKKTSKLHGRSNQPPAGQLDIFKGRIFLV